MTQPKIDSKVVADVEQSLRPHAADMFRQRGGRWMAVVELEHVERTEPAPEEEKEASVKLRVASAEIVTDDHEDYIRRIAEALYKLRTKANTLDEHLAGPTPGDVVRTSSGMLLGNLHDEIRDQEQEPADA